MQNLQILLDGKELQKVKRAWMPKRLRGDVMNINELKPHQINELVQERVMGENIWCPGELYLVTGPGMTKWACSECTNTWDMTKIDNHETFKHPKRHSPLYTQSMDTAWKVVKEMNKPIDGSYARYAFFCDALERLIGSNLLFDILHCDASGCHLTPERICWAALQAVGAITVDGEIVEGQL